MNKTPRLIDGLTNIGQRAGDRLDGLGDFLPDQKQSVPFEEYAARARSVAAADPAFKQEFERALAQYRAVGGM